MTLQVEGAKARLIHELAGWAVERLGAEGERVARFLRLYYAGVALDDLLEYSPEDLFGAAVTLWRQGQTRQAGHASVRVYNPDLQETGWGSPHTVIEIVNDDMPFLVDSVTGDLARRELIVHLIIHPVLHVQRDSEGRLIELYDPAASTEEAQDESFMHVEINQQTGAEALDELARALDQVLEDVRAAVTDWQAMRNQLSEIVSQLEKDPPPLPDEDVAEVIAFLDWLNADNFTFLGYREYDLAHEGEVDYVRVRPGTGLGVLREARRHSEARETAPLSPAMSQFARQKHLLIVTKSDTRATVHRAVHMDYIGVKQLDAAGEVVGERRFVGLFTSVAYSRSARTIPLLRQKVERVLARAGLPPASHDGKALVHILETFPRDELFQMRTSDLYETSLGILQLQERQRIALFVRPDPFERFVSCLVFIPRDRHTTELRQRVQQIVERAFDGVVTAYNTQLGDSPLARTHFIVKTTPGSLPAYDIEQIEERIAEAARTWADHLSVALVEARGEERGLAAFRRIGKAFPTAYRERFSIETAVFDLECIEEVLAGADLAMNLYRPVELAANAVHFKLYHAGSEVPLSDVLPMLENMGLKVVSETPYELHPGGGGPRIWILDFSLVTADGCTIDVGVVRESFQQAFARAWQGELENDGFNRLVLLASLTWREVVTLRAFCRYLRQTGIAFSQRYMETTLAGNPALSRLLVELFATRFDPARREDAEARATELRQAIESGLDEVANLDEDRILRRFLNLIDATLRTNFFQRTAGGDFKPYLSFKLDSRRVEELPLPHPLYEIFVYSPAVEGVHLRGGKVARGGIRWSDRREDFRTEILGLMKAQTVKNAVIVPVGAKGGFVLKRPPAAGGREALASEGIACYKTLIRGLLDLTDNLAGGDVVPPPDVVRLDDDDPYLVVAADKGTATFSDIANGLSAEYGFWLGDAFASGGSAGYDHKQIGITARGAWESVKRHFRELGVDVQSQDFTVSGVGDMSGDVFGNGMLLSPHIQLLGAFNHLHIFVDPDPDPAASLAERQRLFALPRSSWIDYSPAALSPGGAVFERTTKSLTLSPRAQERFGLPRPVVTPNELIRALLTAEVDLLWFGGIGTYVKSSEETHAEVGDRANDGVRIDAPEVRCRVIGEGANLGITQRGRIEIALADRKLNTDAIDNSAGVDTSDHEVNIKILLDHLVAGGDLTLKQRDALLVSMTDEVAELVLRDNYLQTQAISVGEAQGVSLLDRQAQLMRRLERAGKLDRGLESLPDDETLAERQAAGLGLTRPEIAVLLAYGKISLYQSLLASDLPDDPLLVEDLVLYFPHPLRQPYRAAIEAHRLRREIIATYVTNSMVNRVGPTFVQQLGEDSGRAASDIARAYSISRDVFDLRSIWRSIEELDNRVPAPVQTAMILETERLLERGTIWFLRSGSGPLDISTSVADFGRGVALLGQGLRELLPPHDLNGLRRRSRELEKQGVPEALAQRVASLEILASACDIVKIATACHREIEAVGRIYFLAGARFSLEWLRTAAARLRIHTPWQKAATAALVEELFAFQGGLTRQVVAAADDLDAAAIDAWAASRSGLVKRTRRVIADVRAAPAVDVAMLTVAAHQLRLLVDD